MPVATLATAGEISGHVGLESRYFTNDTSDSRQDRFGLSVFGQFEYFHDWDDGNQRFVATPFLRYDEDDSERTHFDLREFYYRKSFEDQGIDLYVGARTVFWGVTESLHLVDVINQTDLVENLDGEDKLGQPMVQLSWEQDWGTLDLFYLPYFRERTFPGENGRLRTPFVVDTDRAEYESGAEQWQPSFAARWSNSIGDWDIGVSQFYGNSPEPRFIQDNSGSETVLVPRYDLLNQTSIDVQYTAEDWLWKLEALTRDSFDGRSNAFVGGFEYTLFDIKETGLDIGLIAEFQYDDRSGEIQPIGDNDIAFGTRFTLNDTNDTDILFLTAIDVETGSQFYTVEADRRIGEDWEVELQARFFANADNANDPLTIFNQEDYFQLTLRKFF
ncbi:MAG: hypothetical protein CMF39_05470 [Legionellaceae bacterium]|nr:hypothetical protein [Legionellaceae bacterium]